jgi:hypothetical protein
MMSLSRHEAILAEGVREAKASRMLDSFDAPSPDAGRLWPGVLAIGAVAALLIYFFPRKKTPRGDPRRSPRPVEIDDRDAQQGDTGRVVKTGADGRATLKLVDGSRLLLSGLSHFEVENAERSKLHSGFLEVSEGRVRLARGAETVEVLAGQLASAEPGRPLEVELPSFIPPAIPDFGSGRGLRGEYFDNEDLTNLKLTRIDPVVDFQWGLGSPHPSIDPDYFSVRWRGQVEPLYSETYTFHVVSDDGARLWVDGTLIVDDWNVRGTRERSGSVALQAGRRHDLRLEYFQVVSHARVSLGWSSPSQPKEIVPARQLYAASSENHLIDEAFSSGALTPGVWDARLENARFEPGYLFFPMAPVDKSPTLTSLRKYDRKPGLCLAAVYLGNIHRGGLKDENPVVQFSATPRPAERAYAGPGWTMGQHMGRYMNTAVPLLEKTGMRSYPVRNDNIDTLFLTVLREKGAFYLTCGEPASTPPRAKLWHVSHTGDTPAYHVAVSGGKANARFASLTLTDLGGAWAQPYGLATIPPQDLAPGKLLDASATASGKSPRRPARRPRRSG